MVVHFKHHCNTYGSLSAYIVAFLVRLSGGEPQLGLPPLIRYPGYDEEGERQLFPFRTMAMIMSLVTLAAVSWWTKWIFETGRLAPQYDYFRCVVNIPEDVQRVEEPSEAGEQVYIFPIFIELSNFSLNMYTQLSVMAGPMGRMYGAATMVGKDEMNGRINPALEPDEDLPIVEAQKNRAMATGSGGGGGGIGFGVGQTSGPSTEKGQTAF